MDAGKIVFADRGYKDASNKLIAEHAAMTAGAIYHYFPTKQALFLAIHEELQAQLLDRREAVVAEASSFLKALEVLLEDIWETRMRDPHAAGFFSVVRVEARRNAEISAALDDRRWLALFDNLVQLGVKTGEIELERVPMVKSVLSATLLGLVQHSVEAPLTRQRNAISALELMLHGELLRPGAVAALPNADLRFGET
jgi:AcrR family transcriptional regulator